MMKRNQPKSLRICDTVPFESIRPGVCVTGVTIFFFSSFIQTTVTHMKKFVTVPNKFKKLLQ